MGSAVSKCSAEVEEESTVTDLEEKKKEGLGVGDEPTLTISLDVDLINNVILTITMCLTSFVSSGIICLLQQTLHYCDNP